MFYAIKTRCKIIDVLFYLNKSKRYCILFKYNFWGSLRNIIVKKMETSLERKGLRMQKFFFPLSPFLIFVFLGNPCRRLIFMLCLNLLLFLQSRCTSPSGKENDFTYTAITTILHVTKHWFLSVKYLSSRRYMFLWNGDAD